METNQIKKSKYRRNGARCAIKTCLAGYRDEDPTIQLFRLPVHPSKRKKWLRACGFKEGDITKTIRICDKHFEPRFVKKRHLRWDAIPSLNLGISGDLGSSNFDSTDEEDDNESNANTVKTTAEGTDSVCNTCAKKEKDLAFIMKRYTKDQEIIKRQKQLLRTLSLENCKLQTSLDEKIPTAILDVEGLIDSCNFSEDCKVFCTMLLKNKCSWKSEEKVIAQSIYYHSTRCYKFLRNDLRLNLPSAKTLSRWGP